MIATPPGRLAVHLYLTSQLMEAVPPREGATCPLTFCKTLNLCKLQNHTTPFADTVYDTSLLLCSSLALVKGSLPEPRFVKIKREHAAEAMSYGLGRKADILCKAAAAVKSDPVPCRCYNSPKV